MAQEWQNIKLSVDLVNAAKYQLEFLRKVDKTTHLYNGFLFDRALYRYEKIWIPLSASNYGDAKLIPPLDVEWVWHLHMLSPLAYKNDCERLCKRVLNHRLNCETQIKKYYEYSKKLWEEYSKTPYEYTDDCTNQNAYLSRIKYDLKSASLRQSTFLYQVSLPHFQDELFLQFGVERYKKFLNLKKNYSNEFIVPCYLIDIIWHSHQLHPMEYNYDTKKLLGCVFTHDDTVSDRSVGSKLSQCDERTRQLWKQVIIVKKNKCFRIQQFQFWYIYSFTMKISISLVQCFEGIFQMKDIYAKNKLIYLI